MTDKQAVLDALSRLPENSSLEEITDELQIMAAVRLGRKDISENRARPHADVENLVTSWATAWTAN